MQYDDYINKVSVKLAHDGFIIEHQVLTTAYSLDLFGISPVYGRSVMPIVDGYDPFFGVGPYWLTFAIISLPSITISTIENYSKTIYDYAFNKVTKSRFFHRIVIPVIASEGFTYEAKSFASSYNGIKIRYPTVDTTRPVLIDLVSDSIYYNSRVTWKYSRTKKIAKEAIEKYLVIERMKKM